MIENSNNITIRRRFSFVKPVIVVALLVGIMAFAVPKLRLYSQRAKEVVAKNNLQILRNVLAVYAARHNGVPPGYPCDDATNIPSEYFFRMQVCGSEGYLKEIPENAFNRLNSICVVGNGSAVSAEATGAFGWIYEPGAKKIRLDWPGTDSEGAAYWEY